MPDYNGRFFSERRNEPDNVVDDLDLIIGIDLGRFVTLPIAAHIRRDDVIACIGQRLELVSPGIPGFRKSMEQQDKWPLTGFGNIQFYTVRSNPPLGNTQPTHAATFLASAPGRTSPQASLYPSFCVQATPPPTITVSIP